MLLMVYCWLLFKDMITLFDKQWSPLKVAMTELNLLSQLYLNLIMNLLFFVSNC